MQAVVEPINLQPIEDPVAPHLFELNDSNNLTFHDYILVSNANHRKEINVTWREVLVDIGPFLISWVLGYLAALVYVDLAGENADSAVEAFIYIYGAVQANTLINAFYQFDLIEPPLQDFFEQYTPEETEALIRLQGRSTTLWAKTGNFLLTSSVVITTLAASVLAAVPMFAVDRKPKSDPSKNHPMWLSLAILFCNSLLQCKGVQELFINTLFPEFYAALLWVYRKYNRTAFNNYKKEQTIHAFRSTFIGTLEGFSETYIELLQTNRRDLLLPIINLANKKNPSLEDTNEYIVRLLLAAPRNSLQFSYFWKMVTRTVGLGCVICSLPAWLKATVDPIYEDLHYEIKRAWAIGSGVFVVSAALTIWVSLKVLDSTYDFVAYALHGIKNAWGRSQGLSDFTAKAWANKFDMASWYEIVRLSRAAIQNPRIILGLLIFLYLMTPFSTQSSTNLNYDEFGQTAGDYLFLPTFLAILLFNVSPFDGILSPGQRVYTRKFGPQEYIEEIKVEMDLQNQIKFTKSITDEKFAELLKGFVWNGQSDPDQLEKKLSIFLGGKTTREILGDDHELAGLPLREAIRSMETPEKMEITRTITDFFKRRRSEEIPFRRLGGDSSYNSTLLLQYKN